MSAGREVDVIREISSSDGRRKTIVSRVEFTTGSGKRLQAIRIANWCQFETEWRRLGYVEVKPHEVDEIEAAIGAAYDRITNGGGS